MSTRPSCEPLEPRRLLSGGFTTPGSPTTLVTIPSVRAASTATAVGSAGDVLIAYVKNSNLFAQIVDASAHVIVPEFEINNGGLPANGQIPMASTTDSSGNAVIVFPIGQQFTNLYIVRINSAGAIVDAPAFIGGTGSQSTPGLAAGPNGQIAIAYADKLSGVTGVFARVLDSSDSPLFDPEVQLSDAAPQAFSQELFTNISVIYNPAASKYLAVWNAQGVDNSDNNLRQAIDDRSFTSAGVLGADPEVDSSTTDDFSKAILILNTINNQTLLAFYQGQKNSFNQFVDSIGHLDSLDADGNATPLTTTLPTTPSPTELLAFAANFGGGFLNLFLDSGSAGPSDFTPTAVNAITTNPQGTVVATNDNIAPANSVYDPIIVPTGTDTFLVVSPAFNTSPLETTVSAAVGTFTDPTDTSGGDNNNSGGGTTMNTSINVTLSATNVTRSRDGEQPPDLIVTATLSEPAESTVKVELNGFSSDPKSFAAPIFDTILIAPGQLQGTVNIHISPYTEGDATDGSVDISATLEPTSEDITLVNPNVSGTVTTINGINTESGTATPGHPFTAEDPDGTEEKISVNDGRAVISTLPDGNLKVLVSGTTAKDSLTIASSSKTADTRFNIEQLIATSPIGTISAPTTDINGSLKLKGVTSLTVGNVANQIALGPVKNAIARFANLTSAVITANGTIKTFSTTDWLGGSLTTTSVTSLTDAGDFDADLAVTTLGTLKISGALGGTSSTDIRKLRATQSFGTISAASTANAQIFAGVKPTTKTLPISRAAFNNPKASIISFALKGATPTFSNTIIAAPILGTLTIAGLVSTNTTPFGIVAESIKSYSRGLVIKKNNTKHKVIDSLDQYSATIV